MPSLLYYLHNGRRGKFPAYVQGWVNQILPTAFFRHRLAGILGKAGSRPDYTELLARVEYCNKLAPGTALGPAPTRLADLSLSNIATTYFHDAFKYTRYFPQDNRWNYLPGDISWIPEVPSIVKSRPIAGDNANGVLMRLNDVRHFNFVKSDIPFQKKDDILVFRGKIWNKPKRMRFFEKHFGKPGIDIGATDSHGYTEEEAAKFFGPGCGDKSHWRGNKLTLAQQLRHKFILCLEGYDVATSLKWAMSSNSIAVMPRPEFETWFMEGTLVPGVHYIEIRPDYEDLMEKLAYYADKAHEAEALEIIRNAHRHVARFQDMEFEKIASLMVLDKYFRSTLP
ncbi:MAG: glycosyl transferase family 90 [Kiritimatiellia bacterium]|jgi:hypothetical protein